MAVSKPNKYIFAIHRGGSSVLGGITKACATASGENPVVLGGTPKAFKETGPEGAALKSAGEIDERLTDDMSTARFTPNVDNWLKRSGVFAPIRRSDYFPPEVFSDGDIAVLNVRDPRDCMVSGYFGFLRLHGQGLADSKRQALYDMGIDAYVSDVLCDRYIDALRGYIELDEAIGGRLNVLTYEEMVTDFPSWFRKFYDFLDFAPKKFENLKKQQGQKFEPPSAENIDQHKRQMMPGDYLRKLKPETIAEINRRMNDELKFFGYV